VLVNDRIVFSRGTLEATIARLGTAGDISTDDVADDVSERSDA
jgi:hypothetical protein